MTTPPLLSAGEDAAVDSLLGLSRVFVGLAARSLAGLDEDVTLRQIRTLVVLVFKGPQRIIDLAQELQVTSSTATRMCNPAGPQGPGGPAVTPAGPASRLGRADPGGVMTWSAT